MKLAVLFLSLVVTSYAGIFGSDQTWAALKITWNPNPFAKYGFNEMPRNLNEDDLGGFTPKDDQCSVSGAKFVGKRYQKDKDAGVTLLFDKNGYIAGMQQSILKSQYTPPATIKGSWYLEDGDFWTLTAYFVKPETVCTTGRTKGDYDTQGSGTGLYIQNGPDPTKNYDDISLVEDDIKKTKWTFGHCFYTMGNHYWYDVTEDMNCDDFKPFFLLYNKGKLNGFGFANTGKFSSPRFEHPTLSVVGKFINPLPKCFQTDPRFQVFSTMHVYFTKYPQLQFC